MNSAIVTTGPEEFTIGSTEVFQAKPIKSGLPWNLAGGSGNLLLTDPNGQSYVLPVTVDGFTARRAYTIATPAGTWVRAWDLTDATGVRQISRPLTFSVIVSPGDPF